jgi:hypothetical protein
MLVILSRCNKLNQTGCAVSFQANIQNFYFIRASLYYRCLKRIQALSVVLFFVVDDEYNKQKEKSPLIIVIIIINTILK